MSVAADLGAECAYPLETERLLLRPFRADDVWDFHRLRNDPQVMRFFPRLNTFEECETAMQRAEERARQDGYCYGPVILKENHTFIGFAGIARVTFDAPFIPATEIGWSLLPQYWGKGYASEAARRWLQFAFKCTGLDEVVSFAVQGNHASTAVMRRIGMSPDPSRDFDHPSVPEDRPELRRHVLYAIGRDDWLALKEEKNASGSEG